MSQLWNAQINHTLVFRVKFIENCYLYKKSRQNSTFVYIFKATCFHFTIIFNEIKNRKRPSKVAF